jgi:hypothetical protein
MVDNYEKPKGESSEWRTPKFFFDALKLPFDVDVCAPLDGFYCVPARMRFTVRENGLARSWKRLGPVYCNPPWSEKKEAVVPWLVKFFEEADGGIFVCVARTSSRWWHALVLPRAELICFPTGKTRFHNPNGSLGASPTNGVALIAKGEVACAVLRQSGLGFCLTVDRNAVLPARLAKKQILSQLPLPLVGKQSNAARLERLSDGQGH